MAIQIFSPKFRDMKKSDVLKSVNFNREWRPYGYRFMKFSRPIGTIFISHRPLKNTIYNIYDEN